MIKYPSWGDPQTHAEHCVNVANANAKQHAQFVLDAQQNGFTEQQARFMAKYLSLAGHVHEYYYSQHHWTTTPQIDKNFTAEFETNSFNHKTVGQRMKEGFKKLVS